jgi:hypothetical protein
LKAAAAAIAAVLCCATIPVVIGIAGTVTAGALLGIAAGALALGAACLIVARRLISTKDC